MAVNSTRPPVADRDDVEPPSTSAAAEGWISESLTLPFPAKPKLASIRRTSESVKLVALALTSMPQERVVRVASCGTRTATTAGAPAAAAGVLAVGGVARGALVRGGRGGGDRDVRGGGQRRLGRTGVVAPGDRDPPRDGTGRDVHRLHRRRSRAVRGDAQAARA